MITFTAATNNVSRGYMDVIVADLVRYIINWAPLLVQQQWFHVFRAVATFLSLAVALNWEPHAKGTGKLNGHFIFPTFLQLHSSEYIIQMMAGNVKNAWLQLSYKKFYHHLD